MSNCVDLPDPSDHSTMMSVPGLSSVEKNISFLTRAGVLILISSFFDFGVCAVDIGCIRI